MKKQLPMFVSLYDLGRHTGLWMEWLATEAKAGRIPVIMQGDKMMFDSEAVANTLRESLYTTSPVAAPAITPGTASYLLAACKELVALWELEGGYLLKSDSPSIQRARAAIAKAESVGVLVDVTA